MKKYRPLLEAIDVSQTQTPEFKKWFGHSKITEHGKPRIVYHGTNKKFDVFNDKIIGISKGNLGHYGYGFYFSTDILEAQTYGNIIMPVYLSIQNPLNAFDVRKLSKYAKEFGGYEEVNIGVDKDWLLQALKRKDKVAHELATLILKQGYEKGWETFLNSNTISDAVLDLNEVSEWVLLTDTKNKEELKDYSINDITKSLGKPKLIQDFPFHSVPQMQYMTNLGQYSKELTKKLVHDGYDGVIVDTEIVAFYPNQIKSAVDNNGGFDRNKNSIYEHKFY